MGLLDELMSWGELLSTELSSKHFVGNKRRNLHPLFVRGRPMRSVGQIHRLSDETANDAGAGFRLRTHPFNLLSLWEGGRPATSSLRV